MRFNLLLAAFVASALAAPAAEPEEALPVRRRDVTVTVTATPERVTTFTTVTVGAERTSTVTVVHNSPTSTVTVVQGSPLSTSRRSTTSSKTSTSSAKPTSTKITSSTKKSTTSSTTKRSSTSSSKATADPVSTSTSTKKTTSTSSTKRTTSTSSKSTSKTTSTKKTTSTSKTTITSGTSKTTSTSKSTSTSKTTITSGTSKTTSTSKSTSTSKATSTKTSSTASATASATLEDIAVYHHNIHRANHSAPDVVWSASLAKIAAEIAATCNYNHNTTAGGGGYGQNIAAGIKASNISAVITDLFYNTEEPNFNGLYGEAQPSYDNFANWGHFSQLVWKDTTTIGCAVQYCSGGLANTGGDIPPYFTVCNYEPPGNYGGEYADNIGEPLGHAIAHWDTGIY